MTPPTGNARPPFVPPARAVIVVERPRCPACGGTRFKLTRSRRDDDGSIRSGRCLTCQQAVQIVVQ